MKETDNKYVILLKYFNQLIIDGLSHTKQIIWA